MFSKEQATCVTALGTPLNEKDKRKVKELLEEAQLL